MTCSLENYISRIGIFQSYNFVKKYPPNSTYHGNPPGVQLAAVYIILILSNYYILTTPGGQTGCQSWGTASTGYQRPCSGTSISNTTQSSPQAQIWDPGINWPFDLFSRMPSTKLNKLAHIKNGNSRQRGKGINCLYWNKGPAFLCDKQLDISSIISNHKPHILGLGEANFRHDHDMQDVQQQDYNLHLDSCVENPDLGMARVAVYTHTSIRVKRRSDLEDNNTAAVWLECGLPNQLGLYFWRSGKQLFRRTRR